MNCPGIIPVRLLGSMMACLLFLSAVHAAPYQVAFKSGTVVPLAGSYRMPQDDAHQAADSRRVHVFLQLENHLGKGDRASLSSEGIELFGYLPDRGYIASIPVDLDVTGLPSLGVRCLAPMNLEWKMDPRVANREFGPWSECSGGRRVFAIDIMPDVTLGAAEELLAGLGAEVVTGLAATNTVLIAIAAETVFDVAAMDFVSFVDEAPPPLSVVNDVVRQRLHVNEVQAAPYNLSGDSVTALVFDGGGVDSTHPDFGTRVHWDEAMSILDHSTHVAGTLGGSGLNSGGQYRGMAPAATIISADYESIEALYDSPADIEADYTLARNNHGIELTTNSLGANINFNPYPCEWMGDYETTSRLLDAMVKNTQGEPLIMCWAAGNERGGGNCNIAQYRCMSVPAGAKNIITVGATTGSDGSASFSSWGPTDDGRIKPEVSATGVSVTSTLPGGGYGDMSGTSMATPATAGVVCLLLEQWHTLFPGAADPLPETMKALLINSTTDNGPVGVDYQTGFGLVNALKAVDNLLAGGVVESAIEMDEEFTRQFTVDTLSALDVSIAWSDVPAAGNVTPTLVNDLDLWLTDPSNTVYRPWKLNPNNPGAPALTGIDTINVCERVHVNNPVTGTWTLHVTGTLNGSESQTFGISANVTLVPDWATIIGQVRDDANVGIPGRVVVVGGAQADNTTADGSYLLNVPGNATYSVRAISYGYVPQTVDVAVTTGQTTQNFSLADAQNGTLTGTVTNQFGTPLSGAVMSFDFPNATIPNDTTDATGVYSATLPGANTYAVSVQYQLLQGSGTALVPENGSVTLDFLLTDPTFAPAGPDAYGYYCYEATDPPLGQAYDWLEISPTEGGPGTAIPPGTGNDWTVLLDLPFNFRFYGQDNTQLKVGADGWIGAGNVSDNNRRYVNKPIPTDSIPNGIMCLFWDDLRPAPSPGEGDLSYYDDATNGRFILEYHGVSHYNPTTNHVTAQLILYDIATRPTFTGDNEFVMQYQSVDYADSATGDDDATIGCENYTGDDGLQIVYAGAWDVTLSPVGPETVYRFTTGQAVEAGPIPGQVVPELFYLSQNYPNPFNPTTTIEYGLPQSSRVSLTVYDLLGRQAAVLENGVQPAGVHRVEFDASHLASGIYYYRIKAGNFEQVRKLLFLR